MPRRASPDRPSASAATDCSSGRIPSRSSRRIARAGGPTTRSWHPSTTSSALRWSRWARASRRCPTNCSAPRPDRAMTRYEPAIDVDGLTAIDVHVHVEVDEHGHFALPPQLAEAASAYFSTGSVWPDLDGIAAYYRERRMAAVVFTVDATTRLGHPAISSTEIAAGASRHHDVLIPFGSVDPLAGSAVDDARRLVEESGVRGLKFHPTVQGFDPSDERHYPLY